MLKQYKSLRRMGAIAALLVAIASVLWMIYGDLPSAMLQSAVACLFVVLLLGSAVQSRLLPSNARYQKVFDGTTVPVLLVDREYQPHYVSGGALPVSEAQLRQSVDGTVDLGDTLLSSAPIRGGHVVWQDDVTWLNELRSQLQRTMEQLGEENALLQEKLELREKRAKADEQNRLYDRIASEVEDQLLKTDELMRRIEETPEDTRSLLAKVCVLGSYIKRRGNLLLLGEENTLIRAKELEYCIRESMDNLNLAEVFTSFHSQCEGALHLKSIVAAYDFYETLVELLLDNMTAMMVHLTASGGSIRMNIQMGCREEVAQQALEGVSPARGSFRYEIMEEDVVIDLTIMEGGEKA